MCYNKKYFENVSNDLIAVKAYYPFTQIIAYPFSNPGEIELKVVAVNKNILHNINGKKEDFTNKYSKELKVIIPYNYKSTGCKIFGGKWFDETIIPSKERHFYSKLPDGDFELCIGVPQSFANMENPILEAIKTAENIMLAYEFFQKGISTKINLYSFSHGGKGIEQFKKEKIKYRRKHWAK